MTDIDTIETSSDIQTTVDSASKHFSSANPYWLSKGEIVRCPLDAGHETHYASEIDGYVYGYVRRPEPDSDNDIRVGLYLPDETARILTGEKEQFETDIYGYFNADAVERWDGTTVTTVDPELQSWTERDRTDEDTLAVLEEEQQNLVQMQELQARTVEPNLLQLPVTLVTSAENSEQWAVVLTHPVVGDLRFYYEKPIAGWSDEYEIVELMASYGILDGNPYKLQGKELYAECVGDDPTSERSWEIRKRPQPGEPVTEPSPTPSLVDWVGSGVSALTRYVHGLFALMRSVHPDVYAVASLLTLIVAFGATVSGASVGVIVAAIVVAVVLFGLAAWSEVNRVA